MRNYDYNSISSNKDIHDYSCDYSLFPCYVVPDLSVSIGDLLLRHQNGDITSVNQYLRGDAKYSTPEDIEQMHVALDNDPEFNLVTAKYYMQKMRTDAQIKLQQDIDNAQKTQAVVTEPIAPTEPSGTA